MGVMRSSLLAFEGESVVSKLRQTIAPGALGPERKPSADRRGETQSAGSKEGDNPVRGGSTWDPASSSLLREA
jgi:hypothetical protein